MGKRILAEQELAKFRQENAELKKALRAKFHPENAALGEENAELKEALRANTLLLELAQQNNDVVQQVLQHHKRIYSLQEMTNNLNAYIETAIQGLYPDKVIEEDEFSDCMNAVIKSFVAVEEDDDIKAFVDQYGAIKAILLDGTNMLNISYHRAHVAGQRVEAHVYARLFFVIMEKAIESDWVNIQIRLRAKGLMKEEQDISSDSD